MEREELDKNKEDRKSLDLRTWRSFYVLEALLFSLFFLMIPTVGFATRWLGEKSFLPILVLYAAGYLGIGILCVNWKCPNCTKSFLTNEETTVRMPFRFQCANCGIKLGSTKAGAS